MNIGVIIQLAGAGVEIAILLLILGRGLRKRFPWFLAYIGYEVLDGIGRTVVFGSGNQRLYFWVFFGTEFVDLVLSLAAVRESFKGALPAFTKLAWFKRLLWSGLCVMAVYWLWQLRVAMPQPTASFVPLILKAETVVAYVILGIGLFYFALLKYFGFDHRLRESSVIAGFSIAAGSTVGALFLRWVFGVRKVIGVNLALVIPWISVAGFLIAEFVWLVEFCRSEPPKPIGEESVDVEALLRDARRHRAALTRMFSRKVE